MPVPTSIRPRLLLAAALLSLGSPAARAEIGPPLIINEFTTATVGPTDIEVTTDTTVSPNVVVYVADSLGIYTNGADGITEFQISNVPALQLASGPINGGNIIDLVAHDGQNLAWYDTVIAPIIYTRIPIPATGPFDTNLEVVDLEGDGDGDIVVAATDRLFVLENNNSVSFTELTFGLGQHESIQQVLVAQLDDGFPEILLTDIVETQQDEFTLEVWRYTVVSTNPISLTGDRIGSYTSPDGLAPFTGPLDAGDENNDGDLDILFGGPDTLLLLRNQGTSPAVFVQSTISNEAPGFPIDLPEIALFRDLNGDGRAEFILDTTEPDPLLVVFWNGNVLDAVKSPFNRTRRRPLDAETLDLDGDGDPEVIALFDDGTIASANHLEITNTTSGEGFVEFIAMWLAASASDTVSVPAAFMDTVLFPSFRGQDVDVEIDGSFVTNNRSVTLFRGPNTITLPPLSTFEIAQGAVDTTADTTIDVGAGEVVLGSRTLMLGGTSVTTTGSITVGSDRVVLADFPENAEDDRQGLKLIDANGDGLMDITLQERWLLSDGLFPFPSFVEQATIAPSEPIVDAETVDLDQDGDADILAALGDPDNDNNSVVWYDSDGGTPPMFTRRDIEFLGIGFAGRAMAVDLDDDGDLDVFAPSSGSTVWYENQGGLPPTFVGRAAAGFSAAAVPLSFPDLNADGATDILAAEVFPGDDASNPLARAVWFESDGADPPSFTSRTVFAGINGPFATFRLEPADYDGDGDLDIVSTFGDRVLVYVSTGADPPGFLPILLPAVTDSPRTAWPVDFDADGDIDILTEGGHLNELLLFVNNGMLSPSFTPEPVVTAGFGDALTDLAYGDLNGDGRPDAAINTSIDRAAVQRISWLQNMAPTLDLSAGAQLDAAGDMTVRSVTTLADATLSSGGLITIRPEGALSGTGQLIADVENRSTLTVKGDPPDAQIAITGVYAMVRDPVANTDPALVVTLDPSDTPGVPKLAVSGIAILDGRLSIGVNPGFDPQIGESFTILTADTIVGEFDGVSLPDVADDRFIAVNINPGTLRPGGERANASITLEVMPLAGEVGFSEPPGSNLGGAAGVPQDAVLADIDGDNDLDLLIALPDLDNALVDPGSVVILYNDPDPGTGEIFSVAEQIFAGVGVNPSGIDVGPLDGNAQPDIAVANRGAPNDPAPDTVSILLVGQPTPPFSSAAAFLETVGDQPADVCIADLNGDSLNDLGVANAGSSSVSVALNEGASVGPAWERVDVDDVDLPDEDECPLSIRPGETSAGIRFLATANEADDSIGLVRVELDSTAAALPSLPTGDEPVEIEVADLNSDGEPELITVNRAGASITVARNTSAGATLSFAAPTDFPISVQSAPPISLAVGNLDEPVGDTDNDIAIIVDGVVRVFRNDTQSPTQIALTELQDQPAGVSPLIVRAGDVNNDQFDDLVTVAEALVGAARSIVRSPNDPVNILLSSPVPSGCEGDLNSDGLTDVFDFADLAANFGAGPGATRQQGDLTGDGFVDVFDFADLAADFGCSAP